MKVIFNKIVPIKGFSAMSFCGLVFVRSEFRNREGSKWWSRMMNHEAIHLAQQKELLFVGFFLLYFLEWLFRLITPPWKTAYKDISFEREAVMNCGNPDYLKTRKRFSQWRKNN